MVAIRNTDKGHSMIHATPIHQKTPEKDGKLAAQALAQLKNLVEKAEHAGGHERAKVLMVAASAAHRYKAMGCDLGDAGREIAKMAISAYLAEEKATDTTVKDLEGAFGLSRRDMDAAFNDAAHSLFRDRRSDKAVAVARMRASWAFIPLLKD